MSDENYADIDLSKSSKERFVEYANNIFNQVMFSPERTTVEDFDEYSESSIPDTDTLQEQLKTKNARLIVTHDRIGDGLPPFVDEPQEPVYTRYIDYHRTSANEIILKDGTNGAINVGTTGVTSIAAIVTALNGYGYAFTVDDIDTTFVSQAATKFLQIASDSVLYRGTLPIRYAAVTHPVG